MKNRTSRSFDKEFKTMVFELPKGGRPSIEIGKKQGILGDWVPRWSQKQKAAGDAILVNNGKSLVTAIQRDIASVGKAK